jgi:hypothetical protein
VQREGPEKALMVHYLLNELSSAEREQIEQRCFQDPDYFDALQSVEEELVDDYARGALTAAQRERFEREWLISPDRRERVETVKALIAALRKGTPEIRPASIASVPVHHARPAWFPWALAAAAIIAAVGAMWVVPERDPHRSDVVAVHQERAELRQATQDPPPESVSEPARNNDADDQPRRTLASRPSPPTTAASRSPETAAVGFVLTPGPARGDSSHDPLLLPRTAGAVRLHVDVPGDIERHRYHAVLRTPEGRDLLSEDVRAGGTGADRRRITVTVPSTVLFDGDYILTLQAFLPTGDREDVTSRAFRIVRR